MKTLTRRHVIASFSSSAVMLCPALLNAQIADLGWEDIPTTQPVGESILVEVGAGPAELDVSVLEPGEVAVIARPSDDEVYTSTGMTQYIGILRRTAAQMEASAQSDPDGVQDPEYFVVNLVCPHRGKAVGITGNEAVPFACTDRSGRHSSDFNASGQGVAGASDESDQLPVPAHSVTRTDGVIVTIA